jgi:enoyl-CoA hydratase
VEAAEALAFGLVNRVVPQGTARAQAEALALQLSEFPQLCLQADRASAYRAFEGTLEEALGAEFERGAQVLERESLPGATRFAAGAGRHGSF